MYLHPIHFCSHVTGQSKFHGYNFKDKRNFIYANKEEIIYIGEQVQFIPQIVKAGCGRGTRFFWLYVGWLSLPGITEYRTWMSRTKSGGGGISCIWLLPEYSPLSTLRPPHTSFSPPVCFKTFTFSWKLKTNPPRLGDTPLTWFHSILQLLLSIRVFT